MGQKRTQNIIDEKIGTHLAEFQKKLTDRIEEAFFSRIEKLRRTESSLVNHLDEVSDLVDRHERAIEHAEFKMTMRYMAAGALGGGIGAMVVILCLVWIGVL
jgi:hypothetical protein